MVLDWNDGGLKSITFTGKIGFFFGDKLIFTFIFEIRHSSRLADYLSKHSTHIFRNIILVSSFVS